MRFFKGGGWVNKREISTHFSCSVKLLHILKKVHKKRLLESLILRLKSVLVAVLDIFFGNCIFVSTTQAPFFSSSFSRNKQKSLQEIQQRLSNEYKKRKKGKCYRFIHKFRPKKIFGKKNAQHSSFVNQKICIRINMY